MRPLRRSFLLAFFTLAVCRHSTDTSSTFSSFSPLALPTPNSQQGSSSPPSQSFSGSPSNTFSPSSSTPSSTSIPSGPPASPTPSSSHSTTSTTSTEASTTSPSTTLTSISSNSSQTPFPSSSTSSLPSLPTSSDVTPATTLIVPDSFTTSTSSSNDPGPTIDASSSSATSSTSFWDNKSAVAGVFVTTALASLVLVAVVAYMVFRRRQRRKLERAMEAEDFIDRGDIEDPYETRGASPTASMTQLTMPNRAEAIVSRDIHFGANYMDFAGQGNYGLDYPPVAVPLNNAGRAGRGPTYPAASNVRHQLSVGSSAAGFLSPPSNSRQTPGRESVATHISYDSFYGGMEKGYGQAI